MSAECSAAQSRGGLGGDLPLFVSRNSNLLPRKHAPLFPSHANNVGILGEVTEYYQEISICHRPLAPAQRALPRMPRSGGSVDDSPANPAWYSSPCVRVQQAVASTRSSNVRSTKPIPVGGVISMWLRLACYCCDPVLMCYWHWLPSLDNLCFQADTQLLLLLDHCACCCKGRAHTLATLSPTRKDSLALGTAHNQPHTRPR